MNARSASEPTACLLGVLFGIGTLLFALRSRNRFWYGSIEIGFASYLFWRLLGGRDEGSLAFGLSALAAVCVLVRGLDNALTGWPKAPVSGEARGSRQWPRLAFRLTEVGRVTSPQASGFLVVALAADSRSACAHR